MIKDFETFHLSFTVYHDEHRLYFRRLSQTTQTDVLLGNLDLSGSGKVILRPMTVQDRIRELNLQARMFTDTVLAIQSTSSNSPRHFTGHRSLQVRMLLRFISYYWLSNTEEALSSLTWLYLPVKFTVKSRSNGARYGHRVYKFYSLWNIILNLKNVDSWHRRYSNGCWLVIILSFCSSVLPGARLEYFLQLTWGTY